MKKKLIGLFCAAALVLSACSSQSSPTAATPESDFQETEAAEEQEEQEAETSSDTIIVVDMNNREVEVPAEINRVVLTALPLPSVYAITGAPIENLVGVHPGSTSAIENSIMSAMYPELVGIADNFIEGTDVNVEELLNIDPDVIIYWGEYANQLEVFDSVGIPAVGVQAVESGDVLETLNIWLDIMGQMFGTTGNTQAVVDRANEIKEEVGQKVSGLTDEEKPRTLYLYNHSKEEISACGSNFYGEFWIEATGGINVGAELDSFADVDMEQIYEWDPEIIILTTFTDTMPEDLLNNTIEGQDWSEVSAVKNGKVYKEPLGVYRWFTPTGDAPLMFKWMAQIQHPELFDYNMIDEIIEYYKEFYDYDVTEEQAQGILEASPEAAKGASFGSSAVRS